MPRFCSKTNGTNDPDQRQSDRGSFIRTAPDEKLWFWPMAGFQSPSGTIYIFTLDEIERTGRGLGAECLILKQLAAIGPKLKRSDLVGSGRGGNLDSVPVAFSRLQNFKDIEFGCGFSTGGRRLYFYAFGVKAGKKDNNICVARFLSIRPEGRWTFWDGQRWTAAVSRAKATIGYGDVPVVKCEQNQWSMVVHESPLSVLAATRSKAIYASVSSERLTGPFCSRRKRFMKLTMWWMDIIRFFTNRRHILNRSIPKNEILVTYSINGYDPCFPDL